MLPVILHSVRSGKSFRCRRFLGFLLLVLGLAATARPASAGESTRYLFGLTAERILSVMDRYQGKDEYDREHVLAAMREPFRCENFRGLCLDVGPEYGYDILEQAWGMALEGVDSKVILEEVGHLLEGLAERYLEVHFPDGIDPRDPYLGVELEEERCTENIVHADAGAFRIRQASFAVDLLLDVKAYSSTAFFKKKSNGNYKAEKAEVLEIEGTIFVTGPLAIEIIPRFEIRENDKRLRIFFDGSADFRKPHVEACGRSRGPVFLEACSCSGPRPDVYEGL